MFARTRDGAWGTEAEPLWKSITVADPADPGVRAACAQWRRPACVPVRHYCASGRAVSASRLDSSVNRRRAKVVCGRSSSRSSRPRQTGVPTSDLSRDHRSTARCSSRPLRSRRKGRGGAGGAEMWERVFRADELTDVAFEKVSEAEIHEVSESLNVDAAWLATRILRVPYARGRRRLDTFLFAQRVFGGQPPSAAARVATALRGYVAFPALMISLERSGITEPAVFARAAEHAAQLNAIGALPLRRTSVAEFQSAVALIERARRTGALDVPRAEGLVSSLTSLEIPPRVAYGPGFSRWLVDRFIGSLVARSSAEETLLEAVAGVVRSGAPLPIVEWEGRQYRVDPASAELRRLQLVRERQGGYPGRCAVGGARPRRLTHWPTR